MTLKNLIKAEFVMLWGELKNYYLNYIFYNLSILIAFIGLFYSFRNNKSQSSLLLLFGLVTWQLCSTAISYMAGVIQDEAMMGTLEQIFMTRTSVIGVFASKIVVNCTFCVCKAMIIFIICSLVFNVQNNILTLGYKNLFIILIMILCVISFYTLGLVFGGLTLYFKKVQPVCNVFTYILLFFTGITTSVSGLPKIIQSISYCIPITWANRCFDQIVNKGLSYSNDMIFLLLNVAIYTFLGYIAFTHCIKKAKKLGKLGQY